MNLIDNGITRTMSRIVDFIVLNILWFVCSLPILTIGASTCALYSVMLKIVRNEEGYIIRGFLKGFRQNFKKATIIWGIILSVSVVLYMDFRIVQQIPSLQLLFHIVFIFGVVMLSFISLYVFPLTARYETTVTNTMKNALILSFVKLPYTILMLIVIILPILITFLTFGTLIFGVIIWSLIGVSTITWIHSMIFRKVFEIFEK